MYRVNAVAKFFGIKPRHLSLVPFYSAYFDNERPEDIMVSLCYPINCVLFSPETIPKMLASPLSFQATTGFNSEPYIPCL